MIKAASFSASAELPKVSDAKMNEKVRSGGLLGAHGPKRLIWRGARVRTQMSEILRLQNEVANTRKLRDERRGSPVNVSRCGVAGRRARRADSRAAQSSSLPSSSSSSSSSVRVDWRRFWRSSGASRSPRLLRNKPARTAQERDSLAAEQGDEKQRQTQQNRAAALKRDQPPTSKMRVRFDDSPTDTREIRLVERASANHIRRWSCSFRARARAQQKAKSPPPMKPLRLSDLRRTDTPSGVRPRARASVRAALA